MGVRSLFLFSYCQPLAAPYKRERCDLTRAIRCTLRSPVNAED